MAKRLPVGRVHGHRGLRGELTVRVAADDAERWSGVSAVWLTRADGSAEHFQIERERSYRDRWVLKLRGLDDATEAGNWRGATVTVDADLAPRLGEFEHWRANLVGLRVVTADREVGVVAAIQPTGGDDLLVVQREDGEEILIPMHREIVIDVDEAAGRLTIDPPDGLLELNHREAESQAKQEARTAR